MAAVITVDAAARGWGNPGDKGSAQERKFREKNIVKLEVAGITLYVHRAISYLAEQFILELVHDYGYSVSKGRDDWGYANRNIFINGRDTGRKSNHSWGLAIDLNATANAVSYDGRVHSDLPVRKITEVAAKYGFFWGGNYRASGYRDPMHFEFLGTPAEAVALTARIRRAKAKATSKPSYSSTLHGRVVVVREGDGWRDIAARAYGMPEWYPIIKNANTGIKTLKPGVRIFVPERFIKQESKMVTVRKGDTYRTLARRYYGNKRKFTRIKAANAGKMLVPGERVRVPL